MKRKWCAVFLLFLIVGVQACAAAPDPFGWSSIGREDKPKAFWWWLGNSVNEAEIDRQLQVLKASGFGGLLVCPLYEYKDPVLPPVEYLSKRWIDLYSYTLMRGKELDLEIGMTVGGGWPMGGPWVTKDNGERYLRFEMKQVSVKPDQPLNIVNEEGMDPIACVTCLREAAPSEPAIVIQPVASAFGETWKVPEGEWTVLIARMGFTKFDVYVAGPGGVGPVFDFWSEAAFKNLVEPFNHLLEGVNKNKPAFVFCDSFEGRGGATPGIFEAYLNDNGYDLRPFLHHLTKEDGTPENQRIWHDYRYTISNLHIAFTKRWTKWAHENGTKTMYQWTGDPANPLDTCAQVDIPDAAPFAVSAAHIMGKKQVSVEAFTWGAGHNFNGSLDYFRKRLENHDGLMQGVNMAVFHGVPFTPSAEPWPGPMYYAGGNFSETQPWWSHLKYFTEYIARLQHISQNSKPDVDVLVLYSLHDSWRHRGVEENRQQPLVWRNSEGLQGGVIHSEKVREMLGWMGVSSDFCSDKLLQVSVRGEGGRLLTPGGTYRALVVPALEFIEPGTLRKVEELIDADVPVAFVGKIPRAVPQGLPLAQDTESSLVNIKQRIAAGRANICNLDSEAKEKLSFFLERHDVRREGLPGRVGILRGLYENEPVYLLKNSSDSQRVDAWVPFMRMGTCAVVGNPRTGALRIAQSRACANGSEVHLVLEPSEVLALRLASNHVMGIAPFDYLKNAAEMIPVNGPWRLSWSDYDGAKRSCEIQQLTCWTKIPELNLYSGVADYETTFQQPENPSGTRWELELGRVCHSAEVWVNEIFVGCAWTDPFRLDVTDTIKPGANTLRLRVANLAQNRVVDLQRKHVPWQKCKLEGWMDGVGLGSPFDPEKLTPVESGLMGPVLLRRCRVGD